MYRNRSQGDLKEIEVQSSSHTLPQVKQRTGMIILNETRSAKICQNSFHLKTVIGIESDVNIVLLIN